MIKKAVLCGAVAGLVLLVVFSINRNHSEGSPPGYSFLYFAMSPVINVTKHNERESWYDTKDGSYLFPNFKNSDDYKLIGISKWAGWYCVKGFPGYCAPMRGIDGKEIAQPSGAK